MKRRISKPMALPSLIRRARAKKTLSMRNLGKKLGYTSTTGGNTVFAIESGKRIVPPARIKRCAKALGIKPESIVNAMVKDFKRGLTEHI